MPSKSSPLTINNQKAEFRGKLFSYLLRSLFSILIAALSGGLLFPVGYYAITKYEMNNTYIDDKPLDFNIKIKDIYLKFLALFGLSIITVGIYIFFIPGALLKWKVRHITYLHDKHIEDSEFRYSLSNYSIVSINGFIISVLSLWLLAPIAYMVKHRAKFNYMYVEGTKFMFTAEPKEYYFTYLVYSILGFLSAGIFKIILNFWMLKYTFSKLTPYNPEIVYKKAWIESFNDKCIKHKALTFTIYSILLAVLIALACYLIYLIVITYIL